MAVGVPAVAVGADDVETVRGPEETPGVKAGAEARRWGGQ